jgi:hypothetical protein
VTGIGPPERRVGRYQDRSQSTWFQPGGEAILRSALPRRSKRTIGLLDVLTDDRRRSSAHRSGDVRAGPQALCPPVVPDRFRVLLVEPARVVYNDALRARETARSEGLSFPKSQELSKLLITAAKRSPERAWLGEVSSVVLQQSLRDLGTAYRNFFDSLKGRRPGMGAPRFKSKRDTGQSMRFTVNAARAVSRPPSSGSPVACQPPCIAGCLG